MDEQDNVKTEAETEVNANENEQGEKVQEQTDPREENERLKKRIAQAEFVIEKLKSEKPKETKEAKTEDDAEARIISRVREEMASDFIEDALTRVTVDPVERERIMLEYRTSIVKTGVSRSSIEADIAKAARLVRADQSEKLVRETAAAATSKANRSSEGASYSQETAAPKDDWKRHLSKSDLAYMTARKWPEERMKKAALAIKNDKGL